MTKKSRSTKKTTETPAAVQATETTTKIPVAVLTAIPTKGLEGIQPGEVYEQAAFTPEQLATLDTTWRMRLGTIEDEAHRGTKVVQFVRLRKAPEAAAAEPVKRTRKSKAAEPVVAKAPGPVAVPEPVSTLAADLQKCTGAVEVTVTDPAPAAYASVPMPAFNPKFPHLLTFTAADGRVMYERFATAKQASKRAAACAKASPKTQIEQSVMKDPNPAPAPEPKSKTAKAAPQATGKKNAAGVREYPAGKSILGRSVVKMLHWMGLNGFTAADAMLAAAHFGVTGYAKATYTTGIGDGKNPKYCKAPTDLTPAEIAQLLTFKGTAAANQTAA